MRYAILAGVFLLFSCTKKEAVSETAEHSDSPVVTVPDNNPDTLTEGVFPISEPETKPTDAFRVVEGNKIIKTINGDMIPLKIHDEFTGDQQEYVLKIKNFNGNKISGKILPENPEMNIRFNQIKLANGDYDGPFGREISYDIKQKGEIWLIVSKSNMASGETKGKFEIELH